MSRPALGGSERLPAKQQWALRLVDGHGSSVQIRARAGNTARATGTEAEVDEDLRATLYGRRSPVADDLGPVHRRQQRRRSLLRRPDGADLPSGPQRPFADRATFSPPAARRSCRCRQPEQVQLLARSFGDEQARIAFLTFVLTGVRRAELQALRWRDVDLIENVLRVADSKTETGLRAIALTPGLHEELWQHRRRSAFKGDDERVFCHPDRGTIYRYESSSGRSRGPGWNGRRG